jgi:RNA polymerase sigma factor (sigma-70 family)
MAPPVNPSDEELLGGSPSASPDALAEFYRRHERPILAFFVRRVDGDAEVARDLTAQTFLHVVEGRTRFRGAASGDATAWLFGIAGHVLSRHRRTTRAESRRHQRMLRELPPLLDAEASEIDRLTEDGPLMAALAHLPAPQRAAVHAYVLGDRSYDEIAREASIGPAAARKRVSRGLAALAALRPQRREDR